MGKKNGNDQQENQRLIFLHDDHKKPTTRRDFLATGLMSFSGYLMAPSILTILGRAGVAHAADECGAGAATARLPAFVNLNLSGGASLASNTIPLDAGGNPLTNYSRVGLGSNPTTVTEFQGALFSQSAATNQMLAGIRATASATTIQKTSFISIAVPSGDDTNGNQLDPSGLITAAGLAGELLPKLGRRASATGVGQAAALLAPPAPLVVRSITDITNALAPAGAIATRLDQSKRESLARLINGLSVSQARTVASPNSASGTQLAKLVQCATDKNIELTASTNPGVDPRQDTNLGVSNAWQMGNTGAVAGQNQNDRIAMGAMVYNALKGNAGSVGLDLGGYDYHGNARATTNQRDNDAGRVLGMILESAAAMNQPVMVYVSSDGSVGSADGSDINAQFNGDRGTGGFAFIFAFHPNARPAMKNDRAGAWQLGEFTASGQSSNDQTIVGTPDKAAAAVFANYLKFANQIPMLEKVLPGRYTSAQLDYVLRFA